MTDVLYLYLDSRFHWILGVVQVLEFLISVSDISFGLLACLLTAYIDICLDSIRFDYKIYFFIIYLEFTGFRRCYADAKVSSSWKDIQIG